MKFPKETKIALPLLFKYLLSKCTAKRNSSNNVKLVGGSVLLAKIERDRIFCDIVKNV